mmetsp:Transcript_32526/g.93633  ORF Transcript_32526/g.93633 Transcript_32526/m.93633 type:complete len:82 (+) Transcript_32526:872-1117(+)
MRWFCRSGSLSCWASGASEKLGLWHTGAGVPKQFKMYVQHFGVCTEGRLRQLENLRLCSQGSTVLGYSGDFHGKSSPVSFS